MKVAIIVPLYKELSKYEEISLRQCFKILANYDIIAVKPKSLDLECFDRFSNVVSFDDYFFESIHGYNELLLSDRFYEKFLTYEYMLIYQLDAFVFKDNLMEWCSRGYDYIGAPWIIPEYNRLKAFYSNIKGKIYRAFNVKRKGLPSAKQLHNCVGNGGLSLRRTELFYRLSKEFKAEANKFVLQKKLAFNEDVFWSIELNRWIRRIKKPNYLKALEFSIETFPVYAFGLLEGKTPFGCHAWDRYLDVWKIKIENEGYSLAAAK